VKNWKAINQKVALQTVVRRISCEVTTKVDMSKMAQSYSLHKNDTAQTVPLDIKGLCRMLYNVSTVKVLQFYRKQSVVPTSSFLYGVKDIVATLYPTTRSESVSRFHLSTSIESIAYSHLPTIFPCLHLMGQL